MDIERCPGTCGELVHDGQLTAFVPGEASKQFDRRPRTVLGVGAQKIGWHRLEGRPYVIRGLVEFAQKLTCWGSVSETGAGEIVPRFGVGHVPGQLSDRAP